MLPFDFHLRTRVVFGPGRLSELGSLAAEEGARRALVVSDPGIIAAGHVGRALATLEDEGIEVCLFDGVQENPTTEHVERGLAVARSFEPDLILGVGGGSSMDCAKGINFLLTNGGQMRDYWGQGRATRPLLPAIGVPTTAGTGSEAQSFALISDPETHQKMACGDPKACFRVALLDSQLTLTQPARVTALTGIDALAHALETYVTRRRNPMSLAFSREAWRLLSENIHRVLAEASNLEARSAMQLGACLAGLAIEHSMLGATHALANPLSAHYDIVHGQAIAIMLPHVIRFNGQQFDNWYRDLLESTTRDNGLPAPDGGAHGIADFVGRLVQRAGLPARLSACGVSSDDLPGLAAEAAEQWTCRFNPRDAGKMELLKLYEQAF